MYALLARALACSTLVVVAGCGAGPGEPRAVAESGGEPILTISALPDQDPHLLQRLYTALSDYLTDELDVAVRYVPVTDYTASVTAYARGDLQLVFFGGLTGVQARAQVPGSVLIAQRDIDARFRSVFIANITAGLPPIAGLAGLRELAGHSFTFGSQSSTSGRAMPQHYLSTVGIELGDFAGEPGFSGSHDATAKLVESGTYDGGVLNAAVWDELVSAGTIDTARVRAIFRSPAYHDYHWLARPDLDDRYGRGFTRRLTDAILAVDGSDKQERKILAMFSARMFIPTRPENYQNIESIARDIGMLG